MDWVPVALACGHVVHGAACYMITDSGSFVECPQGCGWQTYVIDPTCLSTLKLGCDVGEPPTQ